MEPPEWKRFEELVADIQQELASEATCNPVKTKSKKCTLDSG
jgi:hypothetical protein